jgi:hypothetical protein
MSHLYDQARALMSRVAGRTFVGPGTVTAVLDLDASGPAVEFQVFPGYVCTFQALGAHTAAAGVGIGADPAPSDEPSPGFVVQGGVLVSAVFPSTTTLHFQAFSGTLKVLVTATPLT